MARYWVAGPSARFGAGGAASAGRGGALVVGDVSGVAGMLPEPPKRPLRASRGEIPGTRDRGEKGGRSSGEAALQPSGLLSARAMSVNLNRKALSRYNLSVIHRYIQKLALVYSSAIFNFSSYCFRISDRERDKRVNQDFMQVGRKEVKNLPQDGLLGVSAAIMTQGHCEDIIF